MSRGLRGSARGGQVIAVAGAGVSAGKPSALPGWHATNASIVEVLCRRLEAATNRRGWLSELVPAIDVERGAGRFPPEYQAQLIEEMCGDRYFRALQALDIDVINAGHDGIAALANAGALRAVVTTNFDRLIERALDKWSVPYVVAYDDAGYVEMLQRLSGRDRGPLPVLKIHGCVCDHRSMIDTLKQRKRGRSAHLRGCLDALQPGHWLYLGFSAADLEADPDYLGLVAGAAASAGATYVAYPGRPALREGARSLMAAYGSRGEVVVAHVAAYLGEACRGLGVPGPDPIPEDTAVGPARFQAQLEAWADGLSVAAAGLCLAAILEAIGEAEGAVRILDRLVRKELYDERGTADWRAVQLHYGRLGAAWGRFVAVPDMMGAASNASVETTQSLLRLSGTELEFAGASWLACLWLWRDDGAQATRVAAELLQGFLDGQWAGAEPRNDEEAVDAWLSAAQVFILNGSEDTIGFIMDTAPGALDRARRSGDVVRAARVVALAGLASADAGGDAPSLLAEHETDLAEAARVGDGVALGMRALALGRWHVSAGAIALVDRVGSGPVAQQALAHLEEAVGHLGRQGMDPWVLYAVIQQGKAYANLREYDDAQVCVDTVLEGLDRFPVLASHLHEAAGLIRMTWGDENAGESFVAAIEAAEESGLYGRRERLKGYVSGRE